MSVFAEDAALVARGAHCEFPLRSMDECFSGASSAPEAVVFYSQGLDNKGIHRAIRNISVPTVTVYRPDSSTDKNTAVVVCPGGGYGAVAMDREGHAVARYFQQRGLTVAVLKYRLPSSETFAAGLPASQQDALDAIRFLRRHAEEWDVNKNRIGVLGFSAGGHLAGSTVVFGNVQDGVRPDFVALLYPVVTMTEPYAHSGSKENLLGPLPPVERVNEFSLEQHVRPGMPPFFIVHSKNDTVVPYQNSVLLADALKGTGVPTELLLVHTGGHGFALGRDPETSVWKDQFISWLAGLALNEKVSYGLSNK